MPEITDKEFYILSELEKRAPLSQRELSLKAGLSLGMTNYLLQKMAGIGLIKIRQLNRKKISHLLTEKGFKEKARKSYNYVKKTFNSYRPSPASGLNTWISIPSRTDSLRRIPPWYSIFRRTDS